MEYLNKIIKALKPSATLAVKAKAMELKAQGKDIIDFSTGEPDFDTPQFIKDAALKAMNEGKTKYTEVPGIKPLREAIAKKFSDQNGIPTKAENVIVTNGGKQAIHEIFQVMLEPGDEILVISPYWVSYPDMALLAGATSKIIQTKPENGYKLTPAELRNSITSKSKILILNSPSNPTGAAYTKEELKNLGTVISESNLFVLSDEVYEKVVYGNFAFTSFAAACPELIDRTITVNAFSKAYSMTGWRVGYATGPAEVIKSMSKFQSQTTSNVNSVSQWAALAALQGPQDFFADMNKAFWARIQLAVDIIEKTPGLSIACLPEGAFYLFIRIDEIIGQGKRFKGSVDFCNFILEQAGVAAVPGIEFGDDGAFRISVATSTEILNKGLSRIQEALKH